MFSLKKIANIFTKKSKFIRNLFKHHNKGVYYFNNEEETGIYLCGDQENEEFLNFDIKGEIREFVESFFSEYPQLSWKESNVLNNQQENNNVADFENSFEFNI
uniref:Uncharacterized protein n=1 Tax=Parastrongyloides trichosuri TaxID=131310 RepID=A0A0N4Z169_PARTI